MFTKYKLYFIFAAILASVLTIGYLKVQNIGLEKNIVSLDAEVAVLTEDKTRLQTQIESKDDTIAEWREVYFEQSVYRKALQFELDTTTATLERYKSRQDVVFKKPGLVQIKEQRALDKFFDEVRNEE